MKQSHAEMQEGPEAFDRFKKAMRTIVSVPKSAVMSASKKPTEKKKKATK